MLGQMRNLKIEIEQLKKEKSHLEEKMKMVEWSKNIEENKKDGNKTSEQLNMKPTTSYIIVTFDNAAANTTSCDEGQENIHIREWNQFNPGQTQKELKQM